MTSHIYNQPIADLSVIACPHCDLLQRLPELAPGALRAVPALQQGAVASQTGFAESDVRADGRQPRCYIVTANSVPMLGLTIVGRAASTTVFGGVETLWQDGQELVAALVLFTAIVAPALQIGLMLLIVVGSQRTPVPSWVGSLLRHHPLTRIWSMIEVMMLGVLVALVKIADYATVIPGVALFVLWVLVFLLAAIQSNFDPREVWERIEWAEAEAQPAAGDQALEGTS